MSENLRNAVVLTNTRLDTSVDLLGESLERLVQELDFGFRGWGAAMQLFFDGGTYDEDVIDERLTQKDLNRGTVERFVKEYAWFALQGSFRLPGLDRLCSMDVVLRPSFAAAQPACVLFCLDSWFLEQTWGKSSHSFDPDAAEALGKLAVRLGAHPLVDGFKTVLLPSIGEVRPFDVLALRQALLFPPPVAQTLEDVANLDDSGPGLVSGIKTNIVSLAELAGRWPDGNVFPTTSGFAVLNNLGDVALDGASS
jgi:hypothetical protein